MVIALMPPNLEVPSYSSNGMMRDGDGDSPCLVDAHGDDTLM